MKPARQTSRWIRLIAWGLELLYGPFAFAYDLVANLTSLGRWWTWQRAAEAWLGDGPILELGHGTGRFLARQLLHGQAMVAIDRSPQMGFICSRRLRRAGLPRPLVRAQADRLPFASGSFLTVVSTFPTQHLTSPDALNEALRVVTSAGRVVMVVSAEVGRARWPDRAIRSLFRLTGQTDDKRPTPHGVGPPGAAEWHTVEQDGDRVRVLELRPRSDKRPDGLESTVQ